MQGMFRMRNNLLHFEIQLLLISSYYSNSLAQRCKLGMTRERIQKLTPRHTNPAGAKWDRFSGKLGKGNESPTRVR